MVNQVRGAGANEDENGEPSPEQTVDGRQRVARLAQLIKAMPEQRRRVFVMHKLEGLSYGEVAENLGISRSAVEKHMMAALRQIAELRE
jgi:RNA polymerase sigma-70 factor (ECF subfamily)